MSSKSGSQRKKQKVELESPLSDRWAVRATASALRKEHDASGPYKHVVLEDLCKDDRMRKIHDEITVNMKANFKETDLFKVFQTGDLAALTPAEQAAMPNLMSLRSAIYSNEFRNFVEEITGCGDLTDRVDCSCNAYAHSCHLLCHDDVIGTRRVSYIIYLSDPDDPWQVVDGGAVELYPLLASSTVATKSGKKGDALVQGIPENVPTKCLLPTFNTMLIFAVQPGRSYHSVQEVFSATKPRLSISGWYHATAPPVGSDKSSLKQIMTLGDDHRVFSAFTSAPSAEDDRLSKSEVKELSQWVNPNYLTPEAIKDINDQFCANSSLQLNDFIRSDRAYQLTQALIVADEVQGCGHGVPQLNYTKGCSSHWELVGPPHKRRHLLYNSDGTAAAPASASKDPNVALSDAVGAQLDTIRRELFRSAVFGKYLRLVTELNPLGYKDEVRRFRPGLDYTVAHYGVLTKQARLDATLCFVNDDKELQEKVMAERAAAAAGKKGKAKPAGLKGSAAAKSGGKNTATAAKGKDKAESEDGDSGNGDDGGDSDCEDDGDLGYDEVWDGGEVGGFECYIEAEEDPENAEAAEVYRTSYNRDNVAVGGARKEKKSGESDDEEEGDTSTSLLSVSACNNTLSLVMRDEGVMRFVKYVSAAAPGSRWDVAVEYEIAAVEAGSSEDSDSADEE